MVARRRHKNIYFLKKRNFFDCEKWARFEKLRIYEYVSVASAAGPPAPATLSQATRAVQGALATHAARGPQGEMREVR